MALLLPARCPLLPILPPVLLPILPLSAKPTLQLTRAAQLAQLMATKVQTAPLAACPAAPPAQIKIEGVKAISLAAPSVNNRR